MISKFYDNMALNEYQEKAARTAVYPKNKGVEYASLQLGSEAGEVQGKIAKWIRGDFDEASGSANYNKLRELVGKELGDVLWYVSDLAKQFGYSLQEIAEMNIAKLADRAERGVVQGSGDER